MAVQGSVKCVAVSMLTDDTATIEKFQNDAITYLNRLETNIAGVVQSNSASAKETSATSEELSAQSELLKQQVERFRL